MIHLPLCVLCEGLFLLSREVRQDREGLVYGWLLTVNWGEEVSLSHSVLYGRVFL